MWKSRFVCVCMWTRATDGCTLTLVQLEFESQRAKAKQYDIGDPVTSRRRARRREKKKRKKRRKRGEEYLLLSTAEINYCTCFKVMHVGIKRGEREKEARSKLICLSTRARGDCYRRESSISGQESRCSKKNITHTTAVVANISLTEREEKREGKRVSCKM